MAERAGGNLTFDFTAPAPGSAPVEKKPQDEGPKVFTVGELDRAIKRSLDESFAMPAWVEGEVTGTRAAPSGHLYFTLKDEREDATVDVAIYKTSLTPRMRTLVKDGARIRLRGKPTFWAPRGRLQFIADRVDPIGRGALLEALEKLKAKLQAEGLFAIERKRALPKEPRVVGVVTSAAGAAIHDVCKVAFRRGGARILLSAANVQGQGAAESMCRALKMLERVADVDVIILGRGGGSADDLAAFNDEALVRAVVACPVPVVSAVGHEVDTSLVDFAADARAATPSQAAELVVVDTKARRDDLSHVAARITRAMRAKISESSVSLHRVEKTIEDPRLAIASQQQRLDDREARLEAGVRRAIQVRRAHMTRPAEKLAGLHPRSVLARERAVVVRATDRMVSASRAIVAKRGASMESLAARLDAMSPLKVLARGYAIATRDDGRAIRRPEDVVRGDRIHVRVAEGRVDADVVLVTEKKKDEPS